MHAPQLTADRSGTGLLRGRPHHRLAKGTPVTAYQRVLLKLSGEVFGGGKVGVDPDVVPKIAREIAAVVARRASRSPSSSVAATSSAAPSCSSAAWTAPGPTTWACSAPS